MKDYYNELGVPKAINAAGTLTRFGGCRVWPEAADAMAKAAQSFVDIDLLHRKAGEYIAQLLHVESALVTSGASAGLVQSTAACIAGTDPYLRNRLPGNPPERSEVIIQRIHRNPYDNAIPTAGAKFVEIGDAIRTYAWDLENSIRERTAAILYSLDAEMMDASLSLETTLKIAHAHNIPVIVDAAAELPPKSNLWTLVQRGADLVVFSGGKDIRGPQSSGLLVGRKDLLEAAHFNGAPHYGVGRPMKASKELVVGFVAALECYLAEDEAARFVIWQEMQAYLLLELNSIPGVTAVSHVPTQMGIHPIHTPKIKVDLASSLQLTVDDLAADLLQGPPSIIVTRWRDSIILNMQTLIPGEPEVVASRFKKILSG
jgi:L-seryl-tRNA(Ser) seleniumtransferase